MTVELAPKVLNDLIDQHRDQLLATARRIIPTATHDDILQPNDYPELEDNPEFRYEEGYLHGLMAARATVRAALVSSE